ncbi:protoporphyrinogen oxidase [Corynebacterium caspium]|uniref:protoporphyrinogen oxidase n=1 Tax=Corynebacterium caspium TaxID=234828 RepID=UPI00037B0AC6|nr:protoporphyrinogen oxidase [Corynebacterium caspium]WKD59899.1 Protoporphyrinogen oxidase [Corynebacterium caspium DSM 44850]
MRYGIIGAGLAGLVAAREIRQLEPEAQIDVYEAEDRIGGKLRTVPFEVGPMDVGAEAFLLRHKSAQAYFEELGLGDHIVTPSAAYSLVLSGGKLARLPRQTIMGIPATSTPVIDLVSPETAARIDAEATAAPIDWPVGGDLNIGALIRERYGDEVVDHIVSALLGGVYSCTADDLGLRATIPQLAAVLDGMEKPTLSGAVSRLLATRPAPQPGAPSSAIFGTFKGGYQVLYEKLAESADVYVDAFITGIHRETDGTLTLRGQGVQPTTYDRIIVATPAPTTARLIRDLDEAAGAAAAELSSIKLASSVVVAMKFDGFVGMPPNSGILVAADEPDMKVKAFTFASRKWPHIAELGGNIIRASFGRFGDDEMVRADEDTLVDRALDDLKRACGFDGRLPENKLSEIYVQRWFGGLPRYDDKHLETVARIKAISIPGVHLTGAWADGVGVPAVIGHARETAAAAVRG